MVSVTTRELNVHATIRRSYSTVWTVTGKKPVGTGQYGDWWDLTLTHGKHEITFRTLDYVEWLLADQCEPTCKTIGAHTGR